MAGSQYNDDPGIFLMNTLHFFDSSMFYDLIFKWLTCPVTAVVLE